MRRSFGGRHMAWRVVQRWCRPTVDTFFAVVLFSVAGTLLMILWTFEPRSVADQHDADVELQRQFVKEFLHERDQLRKELDGLNSSDDDLGFVDRSLNDRQQGHLHFTKRSKFQTDFNVSYHTGPEMVLRNTGRTRTPKQTMLPWTNRSVLLRTASENLDNDRMLLINSSGDGFLQKVRLKLLVGVTSRPEVDGRYRRSNDTWPVLDGRINAQVASPRWCSVYNTTPEVDESFHCIRLMIKPPTRVCLYSDADDIHVSRHIRKDGLWEPHIVRLFQNLLFQNPDLGVIDIGAHIGQYSLLAASMRRQVVAVEPYPPSLRRLHRAIKINKVEQQVSHTVYTRYIIT